MEETTFTKLIPPGWLRDYVQAMEEAHNEMPLPFHFLTAAAVVGHLIGLGAWATLAKGVRVFPNINVLLLSPAASCRRGEGTKITMSIASRAGVNVFAGKVTAEGLLDEMIERGNVLLYSEELSMLLTSQEHQRALIPVLTKLLLHGEGSADMRTRQMGQRKTVPHVNLTHVATSAPDWFISSIPEAAYGGGMMSRYVVCCLQERDVFHVDIQADDVGDDVVQRLAYALVPVRHTLKGHVKGTDSAQKWMKEWYLHNEAAAVEDDRLEPHRNRKPANLVRLALILAAAAGSSTLDQARLEQALKILDWIEPTLAHLYGLTDTLASHFGRGERRVVARLRAVGGEAFHVDLSRACCSYFKGGMKEMRKCMEGLVEKGVVSPVWKHEYVKIWPPRSWKLEEE